MRDMGYDDMMSELYRENPDFALRRIRSVFEDGDEEDFLAVLRHMAKAFAGGKRVLQENCILRYRELVRSPRRQFCTLSEALEAIGISEYKQFSVEQDRSVIIDEKVNNAPGKRAHMKAPRFAAEIGRLVRNSGLNPLQISKRIEGSAYNHIRRVIKGENFPGLEVLTAILHVLNADDRLDEFKNLILQDKGTYTGFTRAKFNHDGLLITLNAMWKELNEEDKIKIVNFAADLRRRRLPQAG